MEFVIKRDRERANTTIERFSYRILTFYKNKINI